MFRFIINLHNSLLNPHITEKFISNVQSKTIFDSTPDDPYYVTIYRNTFYGFLNILEYFSINKKQMNLDYEYVQSIVKLNNVYEVETQLKANRDIIKYKEILHQIPIIKEMEDKTDKMLELDSENEIACALTKFISGNCWFNAKLSNDLKIEPFEQHIVDQINKGVSLVEPLSEPIALFHGFEKYTNYKIIGNIICVPGIVSKTLSLNVAKKFACTVNSMRPEFLLIHYKTGSKHIKQSIRPFDEEFEFLSHSGESYKIMRICKYFDGIKLLTFYKTLNMTKSRQIELIKQRTKIHLCEKLVGQETVIVGWVKFIRRQGKRYFLKVYDSRKSRHDRILQIMFEKTEETKDYFAPLDHVTIGCSLLIRGLIVESPGKGQKIEMIGQEYYILGTVREASTFPSSKSELTADYIRSIEHLECHIDVKSAIHSVRSEVATGLEKFFEAEDYTKSDMPLITFSECEGGCQPMQVTLFMTSGVLTDIPIVEQVMKVKIEPDFESLSERFGSLKLHKPTLLVDFSKDFFGKKACLTVSAQLELETHLPQGDVWTMTRAVRGEPSQTSRHLTEFSMVELEHAFSTGSQDIIDISTRCIKFCLQYAMDHCPEELTYLEKYYSKPIFSRLQRFIAEDFAVITHADAVTLCREQPIGTFSELPAYDSDLGSEHEKFLADTYFQKPTVIRFYPKKIKAFYMPVIVETPEESHGVEHVDSFDIIVPDVGELVGGSQRIDDYDELMARIGELGLDPEPLKFYTDLRKAGSIPHGGMGMGFERLIKFITCAESVKDCVAYPRFIECGKRHA